MYQSEARFPSSVSIPFHAPLSIYVLGGGEEQKRFRPLPLCKKEKLGGQQPMATVFPKPNSSKLQTIIDAHGLQSKNGHWPLRP